MELISYRVAPEIFDRFSRYTRGVVMAYGVVNRPSPVELFALLREAEGSVRGRLKPDELAELVIQFCGGQTRQELLTVDHPAVSLGR